MGCAVAQVGQYSECCEPSFSILYGQATQADALVPFRVQDYVNEPKLIMEIFLLRILVAS